MIKRSRSSLGSNPITCWSVMRSVSTPRGMQCPQPKKTAGTFRPLERGLQLIIGRLEDFAAKLHDGLEMADWASKRDLIRALVKRVEVAHNEVNVVFRIDPYQ